MIDYSTHIASESDDVKQIINKIFNNPLITGENFYWIDDRNRDFNSDGGCISLYEDSIEASVKGVTYIVNLLLKYNPKKILEVGTNAGSFSIICKEVLKDVQIYTVDREPGFIKRVNMINEHYGDSFINFFLESSLSDNFKNWAKENGPYDFAWIDGNHSYENAYSDIETALVAGSSIVGCDDCGEKIPTGVYDVVNDLVKENKINFISESKIESFVGAICTISKK